MSKREYVNSNFEHVLSEDALRQADRDTQLEVMRTWFHQNFEDPVERTPYESREGGYIWIWGGPYDALEELKDEFSGIAPDDVIEKLATELGAECWQWAPTPSREDYDDYLVEDIAQISEYYQNFTVAIINIEQLLETNVNDNVANCFYRLLYVNVITAIETYLSDAFINTVVPNQALMRQFIETTPEFQREKISLSDVFKALGEIEQRARSYLIDVVWHNIERVKPMYHDTLDIEFPKEKGDLFRAILSRHDIVHRNGKTKSGKEIVIGKHDVETLIKAVEAFVQHVDEQLRKVRAKTSLDINAPPEGGAFAENKEFEEFYKKSWEQYASPNFWFQKAQALYDAANAVRCAFWPEQRTPRDQKAAVSDFYKGPVYMLLAGLAIETVLKGILVGQNPHLVEKQKLSKKLLGHDIKELYRRAMFPKVQFKYELLERLENYVKTFGRYPVTITKQNMAKRLKTRFSSQTDFDVVDQLWNFLKKKIEPFVQIQE